MTDDDVIRLVSGLSGVLAVRASAAHGAPDVAWAGGRSARGGGAPTGRFAR